MSELENKDFDYDFLNQNNKKQEGEINMVKVIIASILLLLLIGGAIYYFTRNHDEATEPEQQEVVSPGQQNYENQDNAVQADTQDENNANYDSEANSDNTEQTTATEADDTTQDVTENNEPESTTEPDADLVYFIVSGAFKEEANAQRKVDNLKSAGYDAVIVGQNANGLFIVAYEGFPDLSSAKEKLNEIRVEDGSAWIYKKKD